MKGDRIGPLVRAGRSDAGMPPFRMGDDELKAIVAFIHTQAKKFAELGGGRRTVDPSDLATGNAADGRACFERDRRLCRMSFGYRRPGRRRNPIQGTRAAAAYAVPGGRPAPAPPKATFTLESGQTVIAPVATEDEFSVTVLDPLAQRQKYRERQGEGED